ncbi:MAG: hypothetical protein ACLR23_20685 [Clostridia bacterium]
MELCDTGIYSIGILMVQIDAAAAIVPEDSGDDGFPRGFPRKDRDVAWNLAV